MKGLIVVFSSILVLSGAVYFFYFNNDGNLTSENDFLSIEKNKPVTATHSFTSKTNEIPSRNLNMAQQDDTHSLVKQKEELANKLFKIGQLNYHDDWCHAMELNEAGSIEALRELDLWHEQRGHFSSGEFNSYADYDTSSLIDIGRQGDLRALYTLVNREDVNEPDKIWASKTAAIFGDTSATAGYNSMLKLAAAKFSLLNGNDDQTEAAKLTIIESLAWAEFAAIRGDFSLFDNSLFVLEDIDGFELSALEEELISKKARELYTNLSNEREALGLDPFDNTVPKSALRNQELLVSAEYKTKKRGVWGEHLLSQSNCVARNVEFMSYKK